MMMTMIMMVQTVVMVARAVLIATMFDGDTG